MIIVCNAGKKKVAVRGNVKLQMSCEAVKTAAEETGLEPQYFSSLVDAAASGFFGGLYCMVI